MREAVVLDMHKLPNDMVKSALSEFTVVRLHGHILKGDQPRELRRLLVFDEAWRVKDSERLQELAREGRAFGVGVVVGTQFPGDIPEDLAGNLATQLMLSNQSADHRKSFTASSIYLVSIEVTRKTPKKSWTIVMDDLNPGIPKTLTEYTVVFSALTRPKFMKAIGSPE
jgi:hypothetical protein